MKRKVISVFMVFVMVLGMVACAKKPAKDVTILAPDALDKDVPVKELDNGEKLYDGYMCKYRQGKYWYYPYVADKMDGVVYVDESEYANEEEFKYLQDKITVCAEYNKPTGCDIASSKYAWGFGTGEVGTPEFAIKDKVYDKEAEKWDKLLIHRNYISFDGSYGENNEDKFDSTAKLRDIDVQAVSFAIYEDFYEEIPQLTVEIYAVTKEFAKKKLGDTYKLGTAKDIIDVYSKDYSDFELVSSKKIDKTGVYYIDWKSIDSNDDYLFYIISLDWEYVSECSCYMSGESMYNITDEKAYAEWKETNKDKFLAR